MSYRPNATKVIAYTSAASLGILDLGGTLLANATTAAFATTLPLASVSIGQQVTIVKSDASVNVITINPNGTDVIIGGAISLTAQNQSVTLVATSATEWTMTEEAQGSSGVAVSSAAPWAASAAVVANEVRYFTILGVSVYARNTGGARTTASAASVAEYNQWEYIGQNFYANWAAATLVMRGMIIRRTATGLFTVNQNHTTTLAFDQAFAGIGIYRSGDDPKNYVAPFSANLTMTPQAQFMSLVPSVAGMFVNINPPDTSTSVFWPRNITITNGGGVPMTVYWDSLIGSQVYVDPNGSTTAYWDGKKFLNIPKGGLQNVIIMASSGVYTPSQNLRYIEVEAVGAGGGGSGAFAAAATTFSGGMAGSGGAYIKHTATYGDIIARVGLGAGISVTVGAGGAAGAAGAAGGAGGDTVFGPFFTARGGAGGAIAAAATNIAVEPPTAKATVTVFYGLAVNTIAGASPCGFTAGLAAAGKWIFSSSVCGGNPMAGNYPPITQLKVNGYRLETAFGVGVGVGVGGHGVVQGGAVFAAYPGRAGGDGYVIIREFF